MKKRNYRGSIRKETFRDKRGRWHEHIFDLYFEMGERRYFIKTVQGGDTMDSAALSPYADKEVEVLACLTDGEWDSDPSLDYPVQSRVGVYMLIYGVLDL